MANPSEKRATAEDTAPREPVRRFTPPMVVPRPAAGVRPRIAMVVAGPDILGGQGVQANTLVQNLRADGWPLHFIPIDPRFPRGLRWVRRVPYLRTLLNQALYLPSLAALRRADTVHVFSASYWSFLLAPLPAMLAGKLFGKRVILNYHSGEAEDHLARWGLLVHPWLKLADEIVVPSVYLQRVFARHGYAARVIVNVVDTTRFRYRDRMPLRPRLLSTRNFEAHYRVEVVLRAFALLRQRCPDATLTVAGVGSEEGRLRRLAAELAPEAIRFTGRVEPARMPALLDAADLFVNASVVDNQPLSILEAMAAGLPVVSTATGDIAAMVRDGETGLTVPRDDPAAMAEAVAALLDDPDRALRLARRAHEEVERHTWARVSEEWADVYESERRAK
jgi:glycosyltransferase involved in cell wall biosynthesis